MRRRRRRRRRNTSVYIDTSGSGGRGWVTHLLHLVVEEGGGEENVIVGVDVTTMVSPKFVKTLAYLME